MAFQYIFKLNGNPLMATLGAIVSDKLEEPLDESVLHIPITVQNYEYKMLGLLQVEMKDTENDIVEEFVYLILSDKVTVISKDGFYSHDLSAVEYTHKFDKYLVNTLTFTRPFPSVRKAPFEFRLDYLIDDPDLPTYTRRAYFPNLSTDPNEHQSIFINEEYLVNKQITIPQVPQGHYYSFLSGTGIFGTAENKEDVYISFDGGTTSHNLTASNATYTYNTKGLKEILLGFYVEADPLVEIQFVPVAKFFVFIVDDKRYSLYDVLMRIRASAPIERKSYFEETRLFDIDETLIERFKQIEFPQMFIQKQSVRQILNTVFKYINAISRLKFTEFGKDILTIDEFNLVTGVFNNIGDFDFKSEQNVQQYATKSISWLENSLQSNFRDNPSLKSPAENRFKTVRSQGVQLIQNENAFSLKLEKELYELSRFEVIIPLLKVSTTTDNPSETVTKNYLDYKLNLTTRLIEKTRWELKAITNNFPNYSASLVMPQVFSLNVGMRYNRGGNFFWERGSKEIKFSYTIGEFFKQNLILEVIQEALREEFTLSPEVFYYLDDTVDLGLNILDEYQNDGTTKTNLFRNLKFNIEYITLDAPTFQADRADISELDYDTQIRINQQERVTDFGRSSRNSYGQLQRSAVPNHSFSRVYTDLKKDKPDNNILSVGNIDANGYIITHRNISFFNEHIEVNYTATKDHNRLNEFNGIDQQYRVFENPQVQEAYKRTDFYNDYVLITDPNEDGLLVTMEKQPTIIDIVDGVVPLFRRLTSNITAFEKVTFAMVRTDGFVEQYPDLLAFPTIFHETIMTPVNSYGGKGALVFNFGFSSNRIAGDAIKKQDTNFYNNPIEYTDSQGFFNEFWFGLGWRFDRDASVEVPIIGESYETYFNEEHLYPLTTLTSNLTTEVLNQNFIGKTGMPSDVYSSYNPIISYKDASSNYNVSYQVNVLPLDYKDYVFGQYFYTDNRLVKNPDVYKDTNISSKLYLYKYKDQTTYNIFDDLLIKLEDKVAGVDYDKVEVVGGTNVKSFISTNGKVLFDGNGLLTSGVHRSWAIADEEGNLYLACNKPYQGFKVILRHFRPNLVELGNKLPSNSSEINASITISESITGFKTITFSGFIFDSVLLSLSTTAIKQEMYLATFDDTVAISEEISGIKQENQVSFAFDGILITEALFGIKQENQISFAFDNVSITEKITGVQQLPNEVSFDESIEVNSSIGGFQQISFQSQISENISISVSTTGFLQISITSGITDSISLSDAVNGSVQLQYEVLFRDYDDTILSQQYVLSGEDATAPSNPTRTGYSFAGWDGSFTNVTSNRTIVATYTANTYTVFFDANGGSVSPTSMLVTFDNQYGELPEPTRTNFTFVGWYTSPSGGTSVSSDTIVTTAFNHDIYARWVGYDWVAGGTEPYGIDECNSDFNLGNVRCDIGTACTFVETSTYFSEVDETFTKPLCSSGAERIICSLSGPDLWVCTIYTGTIEEVYTNCETCSIV